MKLFNDVSIALLSIVACPVSVSAFIPAATRQTALVRKDVSHSSVPSIQPLPSHVNSPWSPLPTSLFAELTDKYESESISADTATTDADADIEAAGKEIDLLEEVDAIFDSVDVNKDGLISADELRTHLVDVMGYSSEYTTYLFASLDTNADGVITKEEMKFAFYNFEALSMYMTFGVGGSDVTSREAFKEFALRQNAGEGRDKLLLNDLADLIFDMIDTDNSGEIDKEELRKHFDNVTNKFDEDSADQLAKEYVQTMFATLDADKNGSIDRQEIQAAFQKYDFKLLARTFGLRVYRTAEV